MTKPPVSSPEPDFPAKRDRRHMDTGEWKIEDLVHEAKERGRTRLYWLLAGLALVIGALGTATASVIKALGAHDREDVHDFRLQQLEKTSAEHESRLWDCCRKE